MFLLSHSFLAIALICHEGAVVHAREVLTPKAISYEECEKRADELRSKYRKKSDIEGCEEDLICLQAEWDHRNPDGDYTITIEEEN